MKVYDNNHAFVEHSTTPIASSDGNATAYKSNYHVYMRRDRKEGGDFYLKMFDNFEDAQTLADSCGKSE